MNRLLATITAIALAAACGCTTSQDATSQKLPASPGKLKVLMIGNSFSICVLKQLPACAKSAGRELDLCSMYIGGCSLERHWQNAVAATNAAFTPYRVDWNYGGVQNGAAAPVAKVVKTQPDPWAKGQTEFGGNIPALLAADDWDVVTLQQASHFSWKPETYEPFGGNLVGLIRKLAPKAEIVVQETWSYTPFDKRLAQWGLTPETMYGKVRPAYAAFANKYGFRVIPTGAAVQHFRRTVPSADGITGDPCGSPTGADKSHLNREGEYLQACAWYATLYRRPASDITYRPDFLTEERAAQMRRSADAVSAPAIRVGTYNIRLQCGEPGTPDCWDERRAALAQQIRKMNLDVFGMQEVCPGQLAYLKTALPEYEFVGDHREKDRKSGEASPVCYRRDRFTAEKRGTFWLSETPEVPASKSWGTCCTRVCSYLVLTDRVTGRRFCFANTHTDHVSAEAREKGMLLIIERMREFGKGCPIVFTGDHNCTENEKPAKSVAAILKNTLYETETAPAGCWRTWNGWRWLDTEVSAAEALKLPVNVRNIDNNDIGKAVAAKATEATAAQAFYRRCAGPRIDYIYVSPGVRVIDYATHSDARKGAKMYPSDHFPVSATVVLP